MKYAATLVVSEILNDRRVLVRCGLNKLLFEVWLLAIAVSQFSGVTSADVDLLSSFLAEDLLCSHLLSYINYEVSVFSEM